MRALPSPLKLTDRAAERVRELMEKADKPIAGLRVGVKTRGCSGLSYFMEYAEEAKPTEDRVEEKGVTLFIEPTATMFLIGSEMDFVQEDFGARFVFNNPNEADRCGCGESFRVKPQQPEQAEAAG
jgi:iron-sulfur cluster assembly protein